MSDPKATASTARERDEHELDFELPAPPQFSTGKIVVSLSAVLTVIAAAFGVTYAVRREKREALVTSSHEVSSLTHVDLLSPKVLSSDRALTLLGTIVPSAETTLYPQANGYVRRWLADIGDAVKKDDLLAEIDTPELDQQLQQAEAQLAQVQAQVLQAQANANLAQADLARYKALTPAGVTSEAELDQKRAQGEVSQANVSVASAAVSSQQANIRRLGQLKSFARVVAPFDGKITQRWAEKGALVTLGNATPLFRIASMDPARVFTRVPQDVVPTIKPDVPALVTIREYPNREFQGKVARTSGELDAASRTMMTEVRVPNPGGELVPGMFARIALKLPASHRVLEVPSTAVVSDARGVLVAIVVKDGIEDKIHLAPVVIERDTGATMELSSGITEDDRVVKIATSQLTEGLPVEAGPGR
jgi:RND family efflux transporter MFP subunit